MLDAALLVIVAFVVVAALKLRAERRARLERVQACIEAHPAGRGDRERYAAMRESLR